MRKKEMPDYSSGTILTNIQGIYCSLGNLGSLVLLLELCPVRTAVWSHVVRVLLDDREHNHLEDDQDVLDRLLDVLHVQPEMVGLDDPCRV
jgi:hypothetical protein